MGDDAAGVGGVGRVHKDQHSGINAEAGELRRKEAVNWVELPQGGVNREVLGQDLLLDLDDGGGSASWARASSSGEMGTGWPGTGMDRGSRE